MTALKALMVDLDGTLIDTREANYLAYASALANFGVTLDRARWMQIGEGRNWRQFLPELVDHLPDVEPAAVSATKNDLYPAMLSTSWPNAGLVRRLRAYKARASIALVTSASRRNAHAALTHHSLADLFDVVVTGCDVARHKPAPDAFRLAARQLAVQPEECLVFEDSEVGRIAAVAFGARCITVSMRSRGPSLI